MPKRSAKTKTGHLITGELAFTIVVDQRQVPPFQHISGEYKKGTFDSLLEAAKEARKLWLAICDLGEFLKTIKIYYHTKGKHKYSQGHYETLNWTDFDPTNPQATQNLAAFWAKLTARNPNILLPS